MSEFKVINSQEELDAVIGERLKRERESVEKKFKDYVPKTDVDALKESFKEYTSPEGLKNIRTKYEEQINSLNGQVKEASEKVQAVSESLAAKEKELTEQGMKIKGFEMANLREKIAHEAGLPYGMGERLRGEEEADIRKDAESLAGMMGHFDTPPRYAGDANKTLSSREAALSSLSMQLSDRR